MTEQRADVLIIGAGIMGAAVAWQLAKRGRRVVLFEQFALSHTRGSSHGASRIFRLAYNQPGYIPIAQRALPLWREAEAELGQQLLYTTGGLDFGMPEDLEPIAAIMKNAGVPYTELSREDVAQRYPAYTLPSGWAAIHQADAGVLDADACRFGLVELARRHGATVLPQTEVTEIEPATESVTLQTTSGAWQARDVVVATGAWSNRLLEPLGLHVPLVITREQVGYFAFRQPAAGMSPGGKSTDFLIFRWPARGRDRRIYGLPNGKYNEVKVAEHQAGPTVSPDDPHSVDEERLRVVRDFVREQLPLVDDHPLRTETCLYASTPDDDFVIDRAGPIILAVGFGGHGFKFGAVIGQMVAEMVEHDLAAPHAAFKHGRFAEARR